VGHRLLSCFAVVVRSVRVGGLTLGHRRRAGAGLVPPSGRAGDRRAPRLPPGVLFTRAGQRGARHRGTL